MKQKSKCFTLKNFVRTSSFLNTIVKCNRKYIWYILWSYENLQTTIVFHFLWRCTKFLEDDALTNPRSFFNNMLSIYHFFWKQLIDYSLPQDHFYESFFFLIFMALSFPWECILLFQCCVTVSESLYPSYTFYRHATYLFLLGEPDTSWGCYEKNKAHSLPHF